MNLTVDTCPTGSTAPEGRTAWRGMRSFRLEDDNGPAISFRGEMLASASSQRSSSCRWAELHVYRTAGGRLVLHELGMTAVPDEATRRTVRLFRSSRDLARHLGLTGLSRDLYRSLGVTEIQIA